VLSLEPSTIIGELFGRLVPLNNRRWCIRAATQPNNPLKAIKGRMNTSTVIGSSLSSVSGIDGFLIIHVE
jgi:hypothetical protein